MPSKIDMIHGRPEEGLRRGEREVGEVDGRSRPGGARNAVASLPPMMRTCSAPPTIRPRFSWSCEGSDEEKSQELERSERWSIAQKHRDSVAGSRLSARSWIQPAVCAHRARAQNPCKENKKKKKKRRKKKKKKKKRKKKKRKKKKKKKKKKRKKEEEEEENKKVVKSMRRRRRRRRRRR